MRLKAMCLGAFNKMYQELFSGAWALYKYIGTRLEVLLFLLFVFNH